MVEIQSIILFYRDLPSDHRRKERPDDKRDYQQEVIGGPPHKETRDREDTRRADRDEENPFCYLHHAPSYAIACLIRESKALFPNGLLPPEFILIICPLVHGPESCV